MITKDSSYPCLGLLVLLLPKLEIIFDFERTWWRLFQKRVVHTKFDIYVLIYDVIIIKAKKINLTNVIL
jgi:predicted lipase